MKKLLILLFVLITIGGAFFLLITTHPPETKKHLEENLISQNMPSFSLPDLRGNIRSSNEWKGKVLVVNFWASWCPPCLREIPLFTELQQSLGEQGVQFVGIAVDTQENAANIVRDLQINYPTLVGHSDAISVAESFGNHNGVLPYTVIIDGNSMIRYIHRGEIHRPQLLEVLRLVQPTEANSKSYVYLQ